MMINFRNFRNLSYLVSLVLVLVCLTFFGFFFNDPLQTGATALTVTQLVSEFAWVILIIVPPLLLSINNWNAFTKTALLGAAIFWPVTLVTIRILLLAELGNPYLGYLVTYPIFIFTDILVPAAYVWTWVMVIKESRPVSSRRATAPGLQELETNSQPTSSGTAPVAVPATL